MKIYIDGKLCECEKGEYILNVAQRNDIYIPHICSSEAFEGLSACRLCIVEIEERGRLRVVTSCNFPVKDELKVYTNTDKIRSMRRVLLTLMSTVVEDKSTLQNLFDEYDVNNNRLKNVTDKCILCGLCVKACESLGSNAISTAYRGIEKRVMTPYDEPSEGCTGCGACAEVCPVNFIKCTEENGIRHIWNRDFKMIKCDICGKYFATEKQLEYIKSKTETEPEHICEHCRKKHSGENFRDVFKNYTF